MQPMFFTGSTGVIRGSPGEILFRRLLYEIEKGGFCLLYIDRRQNKDGERQLYLHGSVQ